MKNKEIGIYDNVHEPYIHIINNLFGFDGQRGFGVGAGSGSPQDQAQIVENKKVKVGGKVYQPYIDRINMFIRNMGIKDHKGEIWVRTILFINEAGLISINGKDYYDTKLFFLSIDQMQTWLDVQPECDDKKLIQQAINEFKQNKESK